MTSNIFSNRQPEDDPSRHWHGKKKNTLQMADKNTNVLPAKRRNLFKILGHVVKGIIFSSPAALWLKSIKQKSIPVHQAKACSAGDSWANSIWKKGCDWGTGERKNLTRTGWYRKYCMEIHQCFKHPKWFGFCWPLVSENPCLPNPSNYESCRGTERIHQSRIGGPAENGHGLAQNANDCLSQPGCCKCHEGFNTMLLDTHCSRKTSF